MEISTLKSENEKLSYSYQQELTLNAERKKKVRGFVDSLTSEKQSADEKCKSYEVTVTELNESKKLLGE